MAVEKMKLLGINGNSSSLDGVLANILFQSDIQIEDAKKVYNKGWKLEYFEYNYKIKEALKQCENLLNKVGVQYSKKWNLETIENSVDKIYEDITNLSTSYDECIKIIDNNEKENEANKEKINEISRLEELDINIKKLYDLEFVKFRYGSIPKRNLEEIKREIENLNCILLCIKEEKDVDWIMYFTTEEYVGNIDGIFNIQKFERELLPDDLLKTPKEYIANLKEQIRQKEFNNNEIYQRIEKIKRRASTAVLGYYRELQTYDKINTIKKYIVHDQNNNFYIATWISKEDLKQVESKLKQMKEVDYVIEDDENPPTKLKNYKLIKPFEELVKMYGMPKKGEIDPTLFVAFTTFIMFGFMFGDVGHGLVFLVLGILLLLKRQKVYGTILFSGGISAILFGILYGSVFGKEDIIKPLLISPMNNITTMLIYGISVGTIFILMAMILNVVNGIRNNDLKKIFFSENGIVGIILYIFALSNVAFFFVKGKLLVPKNIIIIFSIALILIIMFNEPIMQFIEKKKEKMNTPFVEKIFEIIEMMLAFLSNTISFLRLAAFAINHAGLCMAVYLLANMVSLGAGNIIITIIGNIIVLVLEGLIVGIQTLRLEYYELFSRFYDGSGSEFKPIKDQLEE